jgi:hypothetical protein
MVDQVDNKEQLENEINRMNKLIDLYGDEIRNIAQKRIKRLEKHRVKFSFPTIYKLRNKLSKLLRNIADYLEC